MKKGKATCVPAFTDREKKMIRKVKDLYGYGYSPNDWRSLLDQWHWWAANWRKFPGYFLGEVGVLSFEVFLARQDIAESGFPIYEKMTRWRRRNVSRMNARAHNRKEESWTERAETAR